MIESWIISKLIESFDDSRKKEFQGDFEDSLYDKLINKELDQLDNDEEDEIRYFFHELIHKGSFDYFDDILEDLEVYYDVRVGLSIRKLDIHIIYYYENGDYQEFNSFSEMEDAFWGE